MWKKGEKFFRLSYQGLYPIFDFNLGLKNETSQISNNDNLYDVFWKEKDDLKKQIKLWNEKKLDLTIKKINEIELLCKKNHELAINIMIDFLSSVCDEANNYS